MGEGGARSRPIVPSIPAWLACVLGLVSSMAQGAPPEALRFASGVQRTTVIELFTSEGCSSCPPAERYLSGYLERRGLWMRYVPLAFHVTYWNHLGWTDRLAQPAHDARQKRYARLREASTIYTPAFIVNGRMRRPGFLRGEPGVHPAAVGRLEVVVTGREVRAELTPVAPLPSGLRLNLVVLGMGLTTRIEAGENAGREARHDFVVLARRQAWGRERRWRMRLPEPETHGARRHALAAWVSAPGDPTPLQATGGFLPRPLPHEGEGSQGRRPVGHGAER